MKKTICYLTRSTGDWGGASRYLLTLLKGLNRNDFEPLLLLPKSGPIIEELNKIDVQYRIWGQEYEPSGLNWGYAQRVLKAAVFFYQNGIDVLHINHASFWRPAEIIGAMIARVPIITHFHTVSENAVPFLKYCDLVIANSKFTADASDSGGVPTRVIYNPVDLSRYDGARDIRSELGIKRKNVVVSFIGQIREIKGVDLFIGLMKLISDRSVRFLIVGECRDKERFRDAYTVERLNKEIASDTRFQYVGYRSDVENVYRSSDIIVVPSRWDEPFGLINIEAGAARKPVVAARVGGIPEIINHGENGFLVSRDDIDGLAEHVSRLVSDRALRQSMGERGREMVESRFTLSTVGELEDTYRELIEKRRRLFRRALEHQAPG